ncbi:hypothetical protein Bpfe_010568 [Biomphalaria pfeifferi]|uniref:PiggyBac transposable element-derived protein 4 C-terminal zinc-ribbon domain-containing protein n=1 Tax=Biomphalaria pfeifferi TaxID=112525 RepID=A0AAD8BSU5_BIOPF|nr:hypothetical protein Bpfe_010568 [Biomphalaria pfeifferi]
MQMTKKQYQTDVRTSRRWLRLLSNLRWMPVSDIQNFQRTCAQNLKIEPAERAQARQAGGRAGRVGRCSFCDRSKDRKSKTKCCRCDKFICASHQHTICPDCADD